MLMDHMQHQESTLGPNIRKTPTLCAVLSFRPLFISLKDKWKNQVIRKILVYGIKIRRISSMELLHEGTVVLIFWQRLLVLTEWIKSLFTLFINRFT